MELGLGFLIGLVGGGVVALIAAVIVLASRKAMRGSADGQGGGAVTTRMVPPAARRTTDAKPMPAGESKTVVRPAAVSSLHSGNTVIVESMDSPDNQLNRNIQDVRELLLRLADVISSTDDASGKAAHAFHSAKEAIDNVDLNDSGDLAEAQRMLINEIDRVLKTNADLHSELDRANRGIAEQRRQIEELRVQARIDGLTRIPNRASFDERLEEYLSLLQRTSLVFTLLLLDIDHFKRINDDHGHINGDRILRGIAAKIAAGIRTNDFAARYGGEEFAVIFPGTHLDDALLVAERMRQDIAKTNFRLDNKNIRITISGGLAECGQGMGVEEIIAAADKSLYDAKNAGRNQILTGANV